MELRLDWGFPVGAAEDAPHRPGEWAEDTVKPPIAPAAGGLLILGSSPGNGPCPYKPL